MKNLSECIPPGLEGRVDPEKLASAARFAAGRLVDGEAAVVVLEPGDVTRYIITITPTDGAYGGSAGGRTVVSLAHFGAAYPWNFDRIHEDYAYEKWTTGTQSSDRHTARVMAAFLSMVAVILRGNDEVGR